MKLEVFESILGWAFYGDFAAFVGGLKGSFLYFFPSLNLELFGAKSWFSNKAENRILAFAVRCGCFIFHSLYVVIIYFRVYKVPCKKVGKDRFNEIFLAQIRVINRHLRGFY